LLSLLGYSVYNVDCFMEVDEPLFLHFSCYPCVNCQNHDQKPYHYFTTHGQFCRNTSNKLLLSIYHGRSS
jgi:hypothetical protein